MSHFSTQDSASQCTLIIDFAWLSQLAVSLDVIEHLSVVMRIVTRTTQLRELRLDVGFGSSNNGVSKSS